MNKKKNIQFIFTLLVAFCFVSLITQAQTKSTDIKTINGKKYYMHTVEKGQSLYAIAKTYSIDINSVLAENDDTIDGLKNGQLLKIPFESLLPKQHSTIDTNKYVYHIVIKGETLYSIGRQFNIDEKTLKGFNPSLVYGLKEGEQLIISEKKNNKQSNPIEISKYNDQPIVSTYTVLPGETLYSISKKLM